MSVAGVFTELRQGSIHFVLDILMMILGFGGHQRRQTRLVAKRTRRYVVVHARLMAAVVVWMMILATIIITIIIIKIRMMKVRVIAVMTVMMMVMLRLLLLLSDMRG